jgi:ribosomal protein S18 acetylase RimI-like enzyme
MTGNDLSRVVEVHLKGFQGFFLSFLGKGFLTLLYDGFLKDPDGIALVAESGGEVAGFVAGSLHQQGFYQRLLSKKRWSFAWASLGALLRRPWIGPRLLRALRQPAKAAKASAEACLMSIAVKPEAEGLGIGKKLVEAFCREVAGRGAPAVCLTTDREGYDQVNRFYEKIGFQVSRTYVTPEGRAMNEYLITLK